MLAGGVPYGTMELETSGDYDVATFGARVCKVEVMSAGRGVPSLGGGRRLEVNKLVTLDKA